MTAPFGETDAGWDPRFDDGLTRERTALAWQRTGLAFVANGFLLAKGFEGTPVQWPGFLLAVAACALGGFAYVAARFRYRRRFWLKRIGQARDRAFRTVSMGAVAIAAATLMLTFLE